MICRLHRFLPLRLRIDASSFMTIRSHPHVGFAIALGVTSTLISMRVLEGQPFLWPLSIGTGVTAFILFIHPIRGPAIELEKELLRLKQGGRAREVQASEVTGYRIERITSLNLRLFLKDGQSIVHPLDCIVSVKGLEHELQQHGFRPHFGSVPGQ